MNETKVEAVAILSQVSTCLEEMRDEGFQITRNRLKEIVNGVHGDHYGEETRGMADLIRTNRTFRRALFRLDALNEFGMLRRAQKIIDSERKYLSSGRKVMLATYVTLLAGIIGFTHWNLTETLVSKAERWCLTGGSLCIAAIGLVLIYVMMCTDTLRNGEHEDDIDAIMNETIYDDEETPFMFCPASDFLSAHVDDDWCSLPTEAFEYALYLCEILNSEAMKTLTGWRDFRDIYSKEYRKCFSEIGNCYRLFETESEAERKEKILENRSKNGGPQIYNLDKPKKNKKRKRSGNTKRYSHKGKLVQFELEVTSAPEKGETNDH